MHVRLNKKKDESKSCFSLPKSRILRGNGVFNRVFKDGSRIKGSVVDARFVVMPNGLLPWKVGFAAGKKTGIAVSRNRSKRLMKEAFRINQHLMPVFSESHSLRAEDEIWLVFSARKALISYEVVETDLRLLLENLNRRMSAKSDTVV